MRRLVWLAAILTLTVLGLLAQEVEMNARLGSNIDQDHTRWLGQVMSSISRIKPGMTRKDLSQVLSTEGGLSTRREHRYVYKHCPYIKVDVQFSAADGTADESPNDKIVSISKPFLEYPIMD